MAELHKFIFDGLPVRGLLVRLTGSWREVLARRANTSRQLPVSRTSMPRTGRPSKIDRKSVV